MTYTYYVTLAEVARLRRASTANCVCNFVHVRCEFFGQFWRLVRTKIRPSSIIIRYEHEAIQKAPQILSSFLCTIPYLLLWCDNVHQLALKAPPSHSLLSVMLMIGKFQVTLCQMLCSLFRYPADKGSDPHDWYHSFVMGNYTILTT